MGKEIVLVGIANNGEQTMDVDKIKSWEPKDINYFGDVVFFKQDKTYYSMKRVDFKRIFNL